MLATGCRSLWRNRAHGYQVVLDHRADIADGEGHDGLGPTGCAGTVLIQTFHAMRRARAAPYRATTSIPSSIRYITTAPNGFANRSDAGNVAQAQTTAMGAACVNA